MTEISGKERIVPGCIEEHASEGALGEVLPHVRIVPGEIHEQTPSGPLGQIAPQVGVVPLQAQVGEGKNGSALGVVLVLPTLDRYGPSSSLLVHGVPPQVHGQKVGELERAVHHVAEREHAERRTDVDERLFLRRSILANLAGQAICSHHRDLNAPIRLD